jgi:hypothetical protein
MNPKTTHNFVVSRLWEIDHGASQMWVIDHRYFSTVHNVVNFVPDHIKVLDTGTNVFLLIKNYEFR